MGLWPPSCQPLRKNRSFDRGQSLERAGRLESVSDAIGSFEIRIRLCPLGRGLGMVDALAKSVNREGLGNGKHYHSVNISQIDTPSTHSTFDGST
jgi:hypothetical protein